VFDKTTGNLRRKPRFADPAWARDRHQAHFLTQQEFFGGGYFFLSPHKTSPLQRKIGRAGFRLLNWIL
jgi:hypothetical protein